MRAHLLFHDRCFDGVASAALFQAFYREKIDRTATLTYGGLEHGPGARSLFAERLVGDENVILDFRYVADERLSWWFDHHRTSFRSAEDRAHYEARASRQFFIDPDALSCAGFMARTLSARFRFDVSPYEALIEWAERIDSASFESPEAAVSLTQPATQLMAFIEQSEVFSEREEVVEALAAGGIEAALGLPAVQGALPEIFGRIEAQKLQYRARVERHGPVVYCDVSDLDEGAASKFMAYYLEPSAPYAVVVSRNGERTRITVGFSPWHPKAALDRDLSTLCVPYGGGGHSVVGGVDLGLGEGARAREIAREMVQALCKPPQDSAA